MDETPHLQWIRSTAPGRALMRWSPLAVMPLLGLMMASQQPRVSTVSGVVTGILLNLFNLLGIVACVRRWGRKSELALRPMLAWMLVALVDQLVVGIGYAVFSSNHRRRRFLRLFWRCDCR